VADVEKSEHLVFQFTIFRSFPSVSIFVQTVLVVTFHKHVENSLHMVCVCVCVYVCMYVNQFNYEQIISSVSENLKVFHIFNIQGC